MKGADVDAIKRALHGMGPELATLVVEALVTRISELEQILGEMLTDVGPLFSDDPLYERIEDLLAKGTVLP